MTNVFLPFLGPAARSAHYYDGGHSVVVASPDNVAYFERAQWAPKGLVARLRAAAPGTVVPFADEASVETTPEDPPAARGPDRVAIVVDRMTVSAAEAFVLKAMRREKVTVYGEPTGNSIDYQTVSIVRFGCPAAGLYLGYPTIVGSHLLPEGGVRPTGIVPDERLDMTGDPVGDLARRLNALE